MGFPGGSDNNGSACTAGDRLQSLGWEDPLEEGMTTHLSIPAWAEATLRLQRVGHN